MPINSQLVEAAVRAHMHLRVLGGQVDTREHRRVDHAPNEHAHQHKVRQEVVEVPRIGEVSTDACVLTVWPTAPKEVLNKY